MKMLRTFSLEFLKEKQETNLGGVLFGKRIVNKRKARNLVSLENLIVLKIHEGRVECMSNRSLRPVLSY